MALLDGLRSSPAFLTFAVLLLGLCIGSFLNVVIYRLPRMLEQSWKGECRALLQLPERPDPPLSLITPRSRCPSCGAPIAAWQNIPVLSWLLLRARCARCRAPISIQYPLVEAATGLLSAFCAWHFGWSAQLAAALVMTWMLVALTVIDLRTLLLPDALTLPLMWLGLLLSLAGVFATPAASIVGAAAGYGALWLAYQLFRLVTGKEGMGFGDFKLLAALGAWFGWMSLPLVIMLASLAGAAVGLALIAFRDHDRNVPIPFGPYLAAAGWIAMIWGHSLTAAWMKLSAPSP
jgi:leader peptidase (prepilin peptidase)/N-methyltransferase